jgi:hypothetical protein
MAEYAEAEEGGRRQPAGRFRAALVDFDGTVANSEPVHLRSWMKVPRRRA